MDETERGMGIEVLDFFGEAVIFLLGSLGCGCYSKTLCLLEPAIFTAIFLGGLLKNLWI